MWLSWDVKANFFKQWGSSLSMRKLNIDPYELFCSVSSVLDGTGLLLASVDVAGRPNAMAIGWGAVGPIWSIPTFVILVRPSRYTHGLIKQAMDFTVNVPRRGLEEAVSTCGTLSGRNADKFAKTGLTPVKARSTASPIIKECVAHFECKVVCQLDMNERSIEPEIRRAYRSGNYHTVFIGMILHSYAERGYRAKLPKQPRMRP